MKPGPKTGTVVRISSDAKYAYLAGTKVSKDPQKEAPRPFIDKIELSTGKRDTAFSGRADQFEQPTMLDDNLQWLLVVRQPSKTPPNTFLVSSGTSSETKLTDNIDYVPDLTQAHRETITVTRQDGFKFEVKVTLPKYFTYGARPPAFFWFYPSEFVDQAAYDKSKRNFNKNLFTQVGGANKAILTRLGYTLVEPDCPIVGPADRKNDEYVPQLRNNLAAVIDELDRRGWIDRQRLGIGGHSYGAFSTANALVNTPFFKAGIAGDGNFNRSLTPFGFQTDDRQLWDGRAFYLEMSPLLFAERMTGALLMYHGMEDQNVGTDPINSERMFDALEALGKTAALYKYPYEDHGQVAQETILDQWARFVAWLDKYVKAAK
jgi:dipeptidyl aminopeptidase/acylaminoacyl peptidase